MPNQPLMVDPSWLKSRLGEDGLIVVEASFFLPDEGVDAAALFREGHIPGAVRFDVDEIADKSLDLPHMLPAALTFGRMVGELGISDTDNIVIYDRTDLLGGARAWWMFRHFGARSVHLLNGGLKAWTSAGFPLEQGEERRSPATFDASVTSDDVVDSSQVVEASQGGRVQIVDARAKARFAGSVPEPRPGLRSGHIPQSVNLPWRNLIDASGRLRDADGIAATFREAGLDPDRPIIASCGSGVSAAVVLLGLELVKRQGGKPANAKLYDGSWAEWGARADLPIETGP